jgi:hypothetical protein
MREDSVDPWLGRIASSRKHRDEKIHDWQTNVRKRAGEPSHRTAADSTSTKMTSGVTVNKDWPLTKAKTALLYSQTPEVRLSTEDPRALEVVPKFAKSLNEEIKKAFVGAAIEEELADVINAAGISGVVVACEKRTEMRDMPAMDPMAAAMSGLPPEAIPTMPVEHVADIRYPVRRLSPACLLVPTDFTGSIYDHARWLGYEDSMPWATAMTEFGLTEDQKEVVIGTDKRVKGDTTLNDDTNKWRDTEAVNFVELFYWRHFYHPEETSFHAIQRRVYVDNLEAPVIDEEYKGQQRGADGKIVGVKRLPIQILTLTYISDECLPPSDSTISRGQVNELEESRDAMAQQRKHSIPIRWFDTSRVSANTRALIEKGTIQGLVPLMGGGERAIGEVARANFPPEKYELDRIIGGEIADQWTVGPNQQSNFSTGERTAREAGIVERNFQTRVGQERAKLERHFVAIAEILGGLMALHGNTGIPVELLGAITYSVRADSTVLLDADQQIEKIKDYVNVWGQSGFIHPKDLARQHAELLGLDPTTIVIDPQPKPPEPVKISVGSAEDIINPLMLAAIARTGQLPGPDDVTAVANLLAAIGQIPGMAPLLIPPTPPAEGGEGGPEEVATPGIHNADWQEQPRINKRDQDGGQ